MEIGRFLGGVAALIWEQGQKKYLLLRRENHRDFEAGSWECVTGRVNQGESFEIALHREVQEEIGTEIQIEFLIGTTHFFRGKAEPKNELLGLIFGCTLTGADQLTISPEHSEYRWVTRDEAFHLLPLNHWLRKVIVRAEILRHYLPNELREFYRDRGFEI